MVMVLSCDECGREVYRWVFGDKTKRMAEMDLWNSHLCEECSRGMEKVRVELLVWEGEQLGVHKVAREAKIKELRKKYMLKG